MSTVDPTARRPADTSDTAAVLLRAAVDLVEQEGPGAATVRRVARAADMSTIGIYSHFESKEGLFGAVWADGFAQLLEALDDAGGTGAERVKDLGHRYLRWALDHPHLYGVMFWRSIPDVTIDSDGRALAAAAFDRLVTACDDVVSSPKPVALSIWQYLHGAASLAIAQVMPPGVEAGEHDVRLGIEALLRGGDAT